MNKHPDKAAALYYDRRNAPIVSAAGSGNTAEEIIAIAEKYGVPLYENKALADMLSQMPVGTEIPRDLYYVIAEIIAFAYYLTGKTPD